METRREQAEPWTEAEHEKLRSMIVAGRSTRDIAVALGRPVGSTQTKANRLRLRVRVLPATQERIRELAAEGWASSRIAKRLGLHVETVDVHAERARA